MDYIEAVRLARTGDERGFGYLYENTYKSKYYLALRYMKNREAAEDVLGNLFDRYPFDMEHQNTKPLFL